MPSQLIFTSKPLGIQPGRSGFQVVAQHNSISQPLVTVLEKESTYEFTDNSQDLPAVCKYQQIVVANERYYVLTKLQSCGVDFTGRPNHIAHHLIYEEDELPACPPAAIFALWKGWRSDWQNKPRYFGGWDRVNYENENEPFFYSKFALPAKTWKAQGGDEGLAALPHYCGTDHVLFPFPAGKENSLIWLFLESQSLVDVDKSWEFTFTNYQLENDNLTRFKWIGVPAAGSSTGISMEAETIEVLNETAELTAPEGELAEKARSHLSVPESTVGNHTQKTTSAISIAPIDDNGPIQDELGLEGVKSQKPQSQDSKSDPETEDENDELLEGDLTSSLPDQHGDEVFGDIFTPESGEKVQIPDVDLEDESSVLLPEKSLWQRFRVLILLLALAIAVLLAIVFAPHLIEFFNRSADPTPVAADTGPSKEDVDKQNRLAKVNLDPEARFRSQLGEVETIIEKGQFLLARAYLSKYRSDAEKFNTEEYQKLERWFEDQKTILELVNRETGRLGRDVAKKTVLPEFDSRVKNLKTAISNLAKDLQPSLKKSLGEVIENYQKWLNKVRLKTDNVPTFFIPISRDNPNPEIEFLNIPEAVTDWLAGLDNFPTTSQIEHIQIQVSPFKGLNQFDLSQDNAINLSLWKQDARSLISYLDGQTEVIEVNSDPEHPSNLGFHWRFEGSATSASADSFPEPPIILHFLNMLTNQSINIVMMGGISQSVTTPAEVPFTFLELDPSDYRLNIVDPVLSKKLKYFILPSNCFLRLRSLDDRYLLSLDEESQAFHLYETRDLDNDHVKGVQSQISAEHTYLNKLHRDRTIHQSIDFIRSTPLWSLGLEVLPKEDCTPELENFGAFFRANLQNYFEYLRAIMARFVENHTLIRPSVLEQWVAYPQDTVPQTQESITTYRNMLVRTAKRFRTLLKENDPNSLEHWRNFVANLEFWLLGEHRNELIDVLSLSPEEIRISQQTDIEIIKSEIIKTQATIEELQASLQNDSDLSQIHEIDQWILEMASMDGNQYTTPLILFK